MGFLALDANGANYVLDVVRGIFDKTQSNQMGVQGFRKRVSWIGIHLGKKNDKYSRLRRARVFGQN